MANLRDAEPDDPLAELVTPASPGGAIAPTTPTGSPLPSPPESEPLETADLSAAAPPAPPEPPEPPESELDESAPPAESGPVDPEKAVFPTSYVPPPSPAYIPPPPAPMPTRRAPPPGPPPVVPGSARVTQRTHRAGRRLLVIGVALVAIAGGVVIIQGGDPAAPDRYVFGTVTAASPGVILHTGTTGGTDERSLAQGDEVIAGSVIETEGGASAAIELDGGGLVRFDSGARLVFVDLAGDPQTGATTGKGEPAIQVEGGRVWLNPADGPQPFEVQVAGATMATAGNPVALDCDPVCAVEAPAGGVTVTTRTGNAAAPAPREVLAVTSGNGFDVTFAEGPSDWASENLAADRDAGQPEPPLDDSPGIRATALLGGTYAINLEVVGRPTGAAIPEPLRYPHGSTYTVTVLADSTMCDAPPCTVPISGLDGGAGSAEVADGTVALTFSQDIDCFDETDTAVVIPGIGATTVATTFAVGDVSFEGGRFMVGTLTGEGTVSATLTTRCNPRDVLGTSSSPVEATASNG